MSTLNIKLYDFARIKLNLSESDAKEFVQAIDEMVLDDIKLSSQEYKSLWKDDFHVLDKRILETKNDMYKAMFVTGLVQLLAILGGVLAIVRFSK
jgi:hypothetical protein